MVKSAKRRKLKHRLQEQATDMAMTSHRLNKPPAPALFSA
eukprot:CAMPEP_0172663972 /NCGR_PEP_ID=MMETSP1074-20121228/6287_1 /TAXON_ID=2916 /ORGANISM="Ceratium fusus, Strain PA161109" /LENGTH=39 /DNA_ID= /DNA_START= /DNA_END= /DNA_ORIENTATION=